MLAWTITRQTINENDDDDDDDDFDYFCKIAWPVLDHRRCMLTIAYKLENRKN